jgi:hypothetical protein
LIDFNYLFPKRKGRSLINNIAFGRPMKVIKPGKSMPQAVYLKKTRKDPFQRFWDSDRDKVINGLDCYPGNRKKHTITNFRIINKKNKREMQPHVSTIEPGVMYLQRSRKFPKDYYSKQEDIDYLATAIEHEEIHDTLADMEMKNEIPRDKHASTTWDNVISTKQYFEGAYEDELDKRDLSPEREKVFRKGAIKAIRRMDENKKNKYLEGQTVSEVNKRIPKKIQDKIYEMREEYVDEDERA